MSDISASDAGEAVSEAPVESVETEAFDLDAAVEEFASSAPEEWKGKASKIQSELKNLRSKYTPYRDVFDGLHEGDQEAVFQLVNAIKAGDTDGAAEWMFNAAKGLTGEQFEAKFGLTKAEAQAAVGAVEEADEAPELSIEERIQKALDDRDAAHKEQVAAQERQAAINGTFAELGYDTTRNEAGVLADFRTQMVAQLAINSHKGDIKAAHEAFVKLQGDWATDYLKKHSDDQTLAPDNGQAVATADPGTEGLTPAQLAQKRINRLQGGPQS